MSRALDPRLVRHARATRRFIVVSVALGCVAALLIVAQAWLIAYVVAEAFLGGHDLDQLGVPMGVLGGVVLARAAVAWVAELAAARASAQAKSQLRADLLAAGAELSVKGDPRAGSGEVAVLASRGIDALDGYFSQYLPQLVLGVIVPAVMIVALLAQDWISAVIVAFTVPLIPLFMALVGATTREHTDTQLGALQRLAGHFLDVVAGLETLKVFGRARAQARAIARVTDLYRRRALATLRITFLSSLILELVATLAVAIVAVAIGIRLMHGGMGLRAGLFALVLAPEAYVPLRRLGANYHASAEGMSAADRAFAIIEAAPPRPAASARQAATRGSDLSRQPIELSGIGFTYPDRTSPALAGVSLAIRPGEVLALAGPSGCGKSTLLALLLGLRQPYLGSARIGGLEIAALDRRVWHERLAWVPQRPHLFHGSIADNVRLGRPGACDADVWRALDAAGMARVVDALPQGWASVLGDRGVGLSAGERRRLALARAFLRDSPVLLLDEPTADLDAETERDVLEAVRRMLVDRTAVIATHRAAALELCDRVVTLDPPASPR
jgi:thiol reductant ABC exporter CydD subunit